VEEVDLRRIKTGSSRWNDIVDGSGGTDLGLSSELALLNLALEVKDCLVSEDRPTFSLRCGMSVLSSGLGAPKFLSSS